MKELTLHGRIRNAAQQEVENVGGPPHLLSQPRRLHRRMGQHLVPTDECSWAHAFGRMRGFDQVWFGSVTQYDKMAMENWLEMFEKYPRWAAGPRP